MQYIINIEDFEGPLDLLLHLVKTSQLDISTMNTTQIIEGYLEYINTWQNLNIDIASDYLLMAAELIHLKSKIILNLNIDNDESESDEYSINSEEELKNKLIEYEKYKNVVPLMNDLKAHREEYYIKLPENISKYSSPKTINNLSIVDLQNALYRVLLREQKMKPLNTKITQKEISVQDKIDNIRLLLRKNKKINFIDIFDVLDKKHIVATFLAILNMSKNGEITLIQTDNFSNIFIESRNLLWS